jgi:heme-degrading monooxygenase HmoA
MIRVLYSYQVLRGKEQEFIDAWNRVTRTVRTTAKGARGAMLTLDINDRQQFIAISRFETLADFKRFHDVGLAGSEAQKALNATLQGGVAMQVVEEIADLTVPDEKT